MFKRRDGVPLPKSPFRVVARLACISRSIRQRWASVQNDCQPSNARLSPKAGRTSAEAPNPRSQTLMHPPQYGGEARTSMFQVSPNRSEILTLWNAEVDHSLLA